MEREMGPMAAMLADWSVNIGAALLILGLGWLVASRLQALAARGLQRLPGMDPTLIPFLSSIARYLVLIITLIAVLGRFGVQTASIIAVLGAAGLAIGLALQGTLQNIAAGVMLLLLRPFRAGEFVSTGPVTGTVVEVSLFTTMFKTADGLFVTAPNSAIWTATITNFSRNPTRRMDIVVGIVYSDDIDAASTALMHLATADGRALGDPAPQVLVSALGDSAVELTLRVWATTADFWPLNADLRKGAKLAVEAAGCSIPFPQRDVHLIQA